MCSGNAPTSNSNPKTWSATTTAAAAFAPTATPSTDTTTAVASTAVGPTRVLSVEEFGDPDGKPIFWMHTEVGSRVAGSLLHKPAFEYGLRLLCIDRPVCGACEVRQTDPCIVWYWIGSWIE